MISTLQRVAVTLIASSSVLVAACSSPDPDNVVSPTTVVPDLSDVEGVTTTTIAGGRTDRDFQELGLSPEQSSCLLRSNIDRPVDVTLAAEPDGSIELLVDDDVSVSLPGGLRTGDQVWEALLPPFAGSCLAAEDLTEVAAVLGAADDELAIVEDLPPLLDARRSAGFEAGELECVERVLRDAPARISSLAADPRVADVRCVDTGRLDVLRQGSLRNRLVVLGATPDEAQCLATSPEAVAGLDEAAAVFSAGIGGNGDSDVMAPAAACLTPDRLANLALLVAVNDVSLTSDFG